MRSDVLEEAGGEYKEHIAESAVGGGVTIKVDDLPE